MTEILDFEMTSLSNATAWSQLPNAKHIDEVIASDKAYPDIWALDVDVVQYMKYMSHADRYPYPWLIASEMITMSNREVLFDAVRKAPWQWIPATWCALLALVAYDHSSKYYLMDDPDKLLTWHALSDDPACLLLLPAVIARSKIQELVSNDN